MARKPGITPEKRQKIMEAARQLIRAGVSRRSMDFVLRNRFGSSVSKDTFGRLYNAQREQTMMRRVSNPAPSPAPKRRKAPINSVRGKYEELIRRGFINEEAREFSKAQSLRYHEFRRMTVGRMSMLRNFIRSTGLQPGDPQFTRQWRRVVFDWYKRNNLTTFNAKLKRTISPWDWFDQVSYRLPLEIRYSAKGRRKNKPGQTGVETASQRAFRLKALSQLKATLANQPFRRAELEPQIKALGGRI